MQIYSGGGGGAVPGRHARPDQHTAPVYTSTSVARTAPVPPSTQIRCKISPAARNPELRIPNNRISSQTADSMHKRMPGGNLGERSCFALRDFLTLNTNGGDTRLASAVVLVSSSCGPCRSLSGSSAVRGCPLSVTSTLRRAVGRDRWRRHTAACRQISVSEFPASLLPRRRSRVSRLISRLRSVFVSSSCHQQ